MVPSLTLAPTLALAPNITVGHCDHADARPGDSLLVAAAVLAVFALGFAAAALTVAALAA